MTDKEKAFAWLDKQIAAREMTKDILTINDEPVKNLDGVMYNEIQIRGAYILSEAIGETIMIYPYDTKYIRIELAKSYKGYKFFELIKA